MHHPSQKSKSSDGEPSQREECVHCGSLAIETSEPLSVTGYSGCLGGLGSVASSKLAAKMAPTRTDE